MRKSQLRLNRVGTLHPPDVLDVVDEASQESFPASDRSTLVDAHDWLAAQVVVIENVTTVQWDEGGVVKATSEAWAVAAGDTRSPYLQLWHSAA